MHLIPLETRGRSDLSCLESVREESVKVVIPLPELERWMGFDQSYKRWGRDTAGRGTSKCEERRLA